MENPEKVVTAAYVVAFVLAGIEIAGALIGGRMIILPLAIVPLVAGIGLVRRRVWSAYGFALFQAAQLLLVPIVLFRSGGSAVASGQVIANAIVGVVLIALFLRAGKSLQANGAERGLAFPWIAISGVFTLPLVFFQPFVTPSSAMEDTLLPGDHVFVQRWPKLSPSRGDVVVFVYPVDRRETYVKRVIGAPGDHLRILNKIVYRNGAPLKEPYAVHKASFFDPYRDSFPSAPNVPLPISGREMIDKHVVDGEVIVPEKSYFVMGDNRDDSSDSRYWGFVSIDDVLGKPLLIYDSEDLSSHDLNANPAGRARIRWNRFLKFL
jgi:signal peptidase I